MKYVMIKTDTPYCGTENIEYFEVSDDITETELDNQYDEMCRDHAESYEYLASGWGEDFEDEDEREEYYNECYSYGGWEFITEEEYREATEAEGE